MALPGVSIEIKDGNLARTTATNDGVAAIVLTGIAASGLALGTAKQLFSLSEALTAGITPSTHPHAYAQISDFYEMALTGAELWIILISEATAMTDIFTPLTGAMDKVLTAAAGRVTIAATSIARAPGYSPVTTGILDYNIGTVAASAQSLANAWAAKFGYVRIVLDGTYLISPLTGVTSIKGAGENVSVFLGATEAGKRNASIGRFMGKLASIPVHENVARVKSGAFSPNGALTSGNALPTYSEGQLASLHDAGYIVLRPLMGVFGVFVSDDVTLAGSDSDFSSISRGRVIDKAARLAYLAFVNELNDTVDLTPEGLFRPTQVSYLEDIMNGRLQKRLVAEGNCSDAKTYVNPKQNILSTDGAEIEVGVLPLGSLKWIKVKLGFINPASA